MPVPPSPIPAVTCRSGCFSGQPVVCAGAGPIPSAQRESDPSGFSVGSQRYDSEPRDHRGRGGDSLYEFRIT